MAIEATHYIDGAWVDDGAATRIPVGNPANGQTLGTVSEAGADVVDRAVRAASRAAAGWAATSWDERIAVIVRLRDGIARRREDFAQLLCAELGAPISFARTVHLDPPLADLDALVAAARDHVSQTTTEQSLVLSEPVGVVAAITPWNYPLHQTVLKVGAALLAGCTVVLKPSEETPFSIDLLIRVAHSVGLPPGTVNVIYGRGDVTGEALIRHDAVDMISFTGSRRVGEHIGAVAGAALKRVALELGGKSAAIILEDADLQQAMADIVDFCFANSGQTCAALTRVLVPAALGEKFEGLARGAALRWMPGPPAVASTRMGPLVSAKQRDAVITHISRAIDEGARLLCGGPDAPADVDAAGAYVQPTIFTDVTPDMKLFHEEVFGPVLAVTTYTSVDEAIALANATEYGLSAGVWSSDVGRAVGIAKRIDSGVVDINTTRLDVAAPFGGRKKSGIGRECGATGIEEFLETKTITGTGVTDVRHDPSREARQT